MSEVILHRAKAINGWMSDAELTFLAETAQKSKVILEIGSFLGRSTRALADNAPKDSLIYAIDPWEGPNYNGNETSYVFEPDVSTINMFYCHLTDHIKNNKVIMAAMQWCDFNWPIMADFIFIDGDHRYATVMNDIDKALKFIKPGGIISGHDYHPNWSGVVRAVDETFSHSNQVDTIWWNRID